MTRLSFGLCAFIALSASAIAQQPSSETLEVPIDRCIFGGVLTFRDGTKGCLQNYEKLLNSAGIKSRNYRLAVTANPNQCPIRRWASWGNDTSYLGKCQESIQRKIGIPAPQCECQDVFALAKNFTRVEFDEFYRAFSTRLALGWQLNDLTNSRSQAQLENQTSPQNAGAVAELSKVQQELAKAQAEAAKAQAEAAKAQAETAKAQAEAARAKAEAEKTQTGAPAPSINIGDVFRQFGKIIGEIGNPIEGGNSIGQSQPQDTQSQLPNAGPTPSTSQSPRQQSSQTGSQQGTTKPAVPSAATTRSRTTGGQPSSAQSTEESPTPPATKTPRKVNSALDL